MSVEPATVYGLTLGKMKRGDFCLWILLIIFSAIYGFWSVNRHNRFQTDAVDLAIFDQPLWHYSRFEKPLSTVKYNQYPGEHILGDHFHPILVFLAPLYWIWDDVRAILIAQAVLSVLSAWPIYKIALLKIGSRSLALSLSFAYLTFIGFQTALDYDFHETAISILPFSLAVYFLLKDKYALYAVFSLFTVLTKEDMPLFIAMLGLVSIFRFRRVKLGAATFLFGIFAYLLITQVFIPYFKHDRFAYEELDPSLGKTTTDLLFTAATDPLLVLRVLFQPPLKTKTMLNLLASFAFLPLLSPLTLMMTLPNLISRFLTRLSQRWLLRYQYNINLTPILALAVIFGLEDLKGLRVVKNNYGKVVGFASFLLVAMPLIQTARTNAPLLRILNPASYRPDPRFGLNYQLILRIPKDARVSVMAQSSFVPHLSHRDKIFRFEDGLIEKVKPDFVLMSAEESSDPPYVRRDLETKIKILKGDPAYEVLFWDGTRLLMRRRGGG